MIRYADTLKNVSADNLRSGFFEHWPNPPSPETPLRTLENSDEVALAPDGSDVVGFITALTDARSAPTFPAGSAARGRGLGLARRMLARFEDLYTVDLICDPGAQPSYAPLGMSPATGTAVRRYENRAGKNHPGAIY